MRAVCRDKGSTSARVYFAKAGHFPYSDLVRPNQNQTHDPIGDPESDKRTRVDLQPQEKRIHREKGA